MRRGGSSKERLLLTVMFTDIVDSTRLASELGDRRWREVLSRHHAIVRKQLKRHGGREVDTAGDGFFATFDQPARAVACARAAVEELARLDINIRAGIHMGEVEVEGRDVSGLAVHIGSRIMAMAKAGEVLVSSTVRDLMSGSDLSFDDKGTHALKGVPAEWRVYAVEPDEIVTGGGDEERHRALRPETRDIERRTSRSIVIVAAIGGALVLAVVAFLLTRDGEEKLADPAVNTVVRIDPANSELVGALGVGANPRFVAADGDGVWVANSDDETLQRIDVTANTATTARALVGAPSGLAVGGGSLWVTSSIEENLFKIDPGQPRGKPIRVGQGAHGVVFAEGSAWVANSDVDRVFRIGADDSVNAIKLPEGSGPKGIAYGAGSIWVGESLGGAIARIDTATGDVENIPLLSGQPEGLAFGEGYVWVTNPSGDSVTRIDPATNQVFVVENVGDGPLGVATGNGAVWVTNSADDTVTHIDPIEGEVVNRIELDSGGSPEGVTVTGTAVWVAVHAR